MKKKVIIVGGGFGGISAVRSLAHSDIEVTLIDKKNYHLFQPLLYQVATAALSPAEIAYPLRAMFGRIPNINILLAEVTAIDKDLKNITLKEGQNLSFDYLILACGSTYSYFNSPQWEPLAPGLKTISQATEIRRRVFLAFERAEKTQDLDAQKAELTFVVVGGGPTGVELAGALGEITRYTLTREFRHIEPSQTRIILIEAGKRILSTMPSDLSIEASRELEELGVQVWTNSKVSDITKEGIQVGSEFIKSSTILWAAGVGANPLNKLLDVELDRQGRVMVNKDCSLPQHPDIFIIGDQAHHPWGANQDPLPGLAPVATQQGRYVARLIKKNLHDPKTRLSFQYVDKGQMATIGRSRAVAMYKGIHFHGFIAWLAWLLVHIYYLIGFKNRFFVLVSWGWTYLSYRRGARLIIEKDS
jgi:NADH:ubiquinone reductase (H+-translocating)